MSSRIQLPVFSLVAAAAELVVVPLLLSTTCVIKAVFGMENEVSLLPRKIVATAKIRSNTLFKLPSERKTQPIVPSCSCCCRLEERYFRTLVRRGILEPVLY